MLRKKRKWNHKCSVQKAEKEWNTKVETKNKCNEQKTVKIW